MQNSPPLSATPVPNAAAAPPGRHLTKAGDLDPSKPVEAINSSSLPEATVDDAAKGLESMVEHSATEQHVGQGLHMHTESIIDIPHWLRQLIPGIDRLAAEYHLGNFVVVRETGEKVFESMPIYAR